MADILKYIKDRETNSQAKSNQSTPMDRFISANTGGKYDYTYNIQTVTPEVKKTPTLNEYKTSLATSRIGLEPNKNDIGIRKAQEDFTRPTYSYENITSPEATSRRNLLLDLSEWNPEETAEAREQWNVLYGMRERGELPNELWETEKALQQRLHPRSTAFVQGALEGSGVNSLLRTVAAGMNNDTLDNAVTYQNEMRAKSQDNPGAFMAGSLAGSLPIMKGIGSAVGAGTKALFGLKNIPTAAKIFLAGSTGGASVLGGTTAITSLGDLAQGDISGAEYGKQVGLSALGGAVGGTVGAATHGAIDKFFRARPNLGNNSIARAVASGLVGGTFGAAMSATEAVMGEKPTAEDVIESVLVGVAFSLLGSGWNNGTQYARNTEGSVKYFKGITTEKELDAKFKELSVKYHPDKGGDEATYQAITEEYTALKATMKAEKAAESYTKYKTEKTDESRLRYIEDVEELRSVVPETAETKDAFDILADSLKATEVKYEAMDRPATEPITDVSRLEPVAKTLGPNGAKAIISGYDGEMDIVDYADDFVRVYNNMRNGIEEVPKDIKLSGEQVLRAQFAATNDGGNNGRNISVSGKPEWRNGKSESERSGKLDGKAESISGEGSGSNQRERAARRRALGRDRGTRREIREVISNSQSVVKEYTKADIEAMGDKELIDIADKNAENGINTHFYEGRITLDDGATAMGFVKGNERWIQVDDDYRTAAKTDKHEDFHTALDRGDREEALVAVSHAIKKKLGKEAIQKYAELYLGHGIRSKEDLYYVIEEIAADAYADIDEAEDVSTLKGVAEQIVGRNAAGYRREGNEVQRLDKEQSGRRDVEHDSNRNNERFSENREGKPLENTSNADSDGNPLSKGQQEYFADSKVRDANGNLEVVYHGTPSGGFTVFKNDLNFFTGNKAYADRYQTPSASSRVAGKEQSNPMTYKGYLNITNPFDISNADHRRIFIEEYVKGGNALGINPYISNEEIAQQISGGIDWTEADNLKEFFDDNEYDFDGIILNEGGDLVDGSAVKRGLPYVTFDSNQFKNIDNLNPSKDADIRFSMKQPAEAEDNKPRSAQAQRDEGYMLSEPKFYQLYSAHKIDVGNRFGDIAEQINSIKNNGFTSNTNNANVMPTSSSRYLIDKNGDPKYDNYIQQVYAPKKGEYVVFVPANYVDKSDRIANGFKPLDYEIAQVEYDNQPYYELYKNTYKKSNADIRFSKRVSEIEGQLSMDIQEDMRRKSAEAIAKIGEGEIESTMSSKVKTLAVGFREDLINKHHVSLVGQTVKSANDLAVLAQVYRDPRFETARYFFVDDNGKIVSHTGVSSRLASASGLFPRDAYTFAARIATEAKKLGATKAYLLHNHPSGDPTPSGPDHSAIGVVEHLFEHYGIAETTGIIINSKKYSVFYSSHTTEMFDLEGEDKLLEGVGNKDLLSEAITSSNALANLAKKLQLADGYSTAVFVGARGQVTAVQEVHRSIIHDEVALAEYVEASSNKYGAMSTFLVTNNAEDYEAGLKGYEISLLTDVVLHREDSYRSAGETGAYRPIGKINGSAGVAMRWSDEDTSSEPRFSKRVDADGNPLSEGQQEYFKDSKVRNKKGELIKVYKGVNEDFTVFNDSIAFFSEDKRVAQTYTGKNKIMEGYLDIEMPYVVDAKGADWSHVPLSKELEKIVLKYGGEVKNSVSTTDIITEALYKANYHGDITIDGIKFVNVEDNGIHGIAEAKGATNWVTFRRADFKRADNLNPTRNKDIRFSRVSDLRDVNEELKNAVRELQKTERALERQKQKTADAKAQTHRTKELTIDKRDIAKLTKAVIGEYSSTADAVEVSMGIDKIAKLILNGNVDENWADVKAAAVDTASYIVSNARELVRDDNYKKLIDYFKEFKISPEGIDIPDFKDFKNKWRGKLTFSTEGKSIDKKWGELQELFGEGMFPSDVTHPADMIEHIADVLTSLEPVYLNPYEAELAEAIEYEADSLIERITEQRLAPPTFADKQKAIADARVEKAKQSGNKKLADEKAKNKERLAEVRKKRDEKIAELKRGFAEAKEADKVRRAERELREKITSHAKDLTEKVLNPTDKKHIPEELRGATLKVLESINLSESKRTLAFMALREKLRSSQDTAVFDPDLLENDGLLDKIAKLSEVPIKDMDIDQLNMISEALSAVEGMIRTENKAFAIRNKERISDIALNIYEQNKDKPKAVASRTGAMSRIDLAMTTPDTYFHILGADDVFDAMFDANDSYIRMLKKSITSVKEAMEETGIVPSELEKAMHTITLGGQKMEVPTSYLMDLYNLVRRGEDATKHFFGGGGIRIADYKKKGKTTEYRTAIRGIMPGEIVDALRQLQPNEIQFAEKLAHFVGVDMAAYGNESTMKVYNYKKFNEGETYWHIKSNQNDIFSDAKQTDRPTSVAGLGMAKPLQRGANTSVYVRSVLDSFTESVTDMANYAAWLPIDTDISRIRNYQFKDEDGVRAETMAGVLETVFGKRGPDYWAKLMQDLSSGLRSESLYVGGLIGNMKAAAVGANLRVIIQQPTAILRAFADIDPKYFSGEIVNDEIKSGWKKAVKYAPIAQWKDWGYFDMNVGNTFKNILFGTDGFVDKARELSMKGAAKADSISWGILWNACEREAKDKDANALIVPSTDISARNQIVVAGQEDGTANKFNKAVAKRFSQIICRTQVVDTMLLRSEAMRMGDPFSKMATAFMSEPTRIYNMLKRAEHDKKKPSGKKRFRRVMAALLLSVVTNATAQSIIDAMRDDDVDQTYLDKWLEAFLWDFDDTNLSNVLKSNLIGALNPASYIVFLKDIVSILEGYDISRMDMDNIDKTANAVKAFTSSLKGEGKYNIAGASINVVGEASRLLGVPVYNIKRDLYAATTTFAQATNNYLLTYYTWKTQYRMNNSSVKSDVYKLLYEAYKNDREAYNAIRRDLIRDGALDTSTKTTAENIDARMKQMDK